MRKLLKSAREYFTRLTIRSKLILVILLFSILPTVIGGISSYSISSYWSEREGKNSAVQMVSMTSSNLNKLFDGMQSIVYMLSVNKTLVDNLDHTLVSDLDKYNLSSSLDNSIIKDLGSIYDFLKNVIVYSENGEYSIVIGTMGESITKGYKEFEIYKSSKEHQGKIEWYGPHDYEGDLYGYKLRDIISAAKSINKYENYKFQGVVEVQTDVGKILDTLQSAIGNKNSYIYMLDSNRNIILSTKNPSDTKAIPNIDFDQIPDVISGSETLSSSGNEKYYCVYSKLSNGWTMVYSVPYRLFSSSSRDILKNTMVIVLTSVFFTVTLIGLVSNGLTKPIRVLIKSMDKLTTGDFNISIKQQKGKNEIAELSRNFNMMVVKIKTLIDELIEKENKKKEAELDVLQAQIAPHFLYNTLNMIKCMAMLKNEKEIADVTKALTSLLELSINNRRNLITIDDEIEITNQYILLQKYKLSRQFDVEMNVSEEVLMYKTPKLILQPIIENSLIHGFVHSDRSNLIEINIFKEHDDIFMVVTDNGVGIAPQKVDQILDSTRGRSKFNRIGINNLNDRIKLFFGDVYGIRIESCENEYTRVTVHFPAVTAEQEERRIGGSDV